MMIAVFYVKSSRQGHERNLGIFSCLGVSEDGTIIKAHHIIF